VGLQGLLNDPVDRPPIRVPHLVGDGLIAMATNGQLNGPGTPFLCQGLVPVPPGYSG
jgi:hypothetical protein